MRKKLKVSGKKLWNHSIIVVVFLFQKLPGMKGEETAIWVLSVSFPKGSEISMAFPEPVTLGLMDSNQLSIFLEILVFRRLNHREE